MPKELVPCRIRNVINNILIDRDEVLFPPLHFKLGLIKRFTKALDKNGGCFTYLCHAFSGLTLKKLKAGIFDGPQIRQLINDPWKLNKRSVTGNMESFCSGRELSWQQEDQELCRTCHQYADCFKKPWMQHEHQNALIILKYESVFWEYGISEWWTRGQIPSGHKRDGDQASGTLGYSHDCWLLLDSEEIHPCWWAFEAFKETEVHALNFAQWQRNVQFTCTYLYQCWMRNINENQLMSQKCNQFSQKIGFFKIKLA